METLPGPALPSENATRKRKKRNRASKPKESQRKSLNAHLLQLTAALETISKGTKKKPARREHHLQQIALIQAQLNELDQQSDDPDSASEALSALQKFSPHSPIVPAPEQQRLPLKPPGSTISTAAKHWNGIDGNTVPPLIKTPLTPMFGQQWNCIYGQPIPPPAGMSSAAMLAQQWHPSKGSTHPRSHTSGIPAASTFGPQWRSDREQASVTTNPESRTTPFAQQWPPFSAQSPLPSNLPSGGPSFWQQWQNFGAQPSSSSSLSSGAHNFGQQRLPANVAGSVPSNARPFSTIPSFGSQWLPSNPYASPTPNSAVTTSSVPYVWDNPILQARGSESSAHSGLQNRHASNNRLHQLPLRLIESATSAGSSRQTRGVLIDFAKVATDMPEDYKSEDDHDYVDGTQQTSKTKARKKKADRHRDPIVPPSKASGGVPEPSQQYLSRCNLPSAQAKSSQHILLVIDLNGTILHRPNRSRPTHFVERTDTRFFLEYVLDNFNVMVWSSARTENVNAMCQQLFPGHLRQRLVAVWGRDRMGLTPSDYTKRVQVYKRLSLIWDNLEIQMGHPESAQGRYWDQKNTVLLDDSMEKARSEPHNLVQVPEFEGKSEDPNILGDLSHYLTALKMQQDVSAFMRESPFKVAAKS